MEKPTFDQLNYFLILSRECEARGIELPQEVIDIKEDPDPDKQQVQQAITDLRFELGFKEQR